MKYIHIISLFFCTAFCIRAQTVTELYNSKKYEELVKQDNYKGTLTADELYMVGFAWYRLENDDKAIEYYNKAIDKGLDDGPVHFYKGLSLRYKKDYEQALKEIEVSLKWEPDNQEYMNEKGMIYFDQKKFDKALEIFLQAEKLPQTFPEPYYWVARIYQENKEYDKALAGYYEALKALPRTNTYYVSSLSCIGQLEYSVSKNYAKSAKAYTQALLIEPEEYELSYGLIKALNAEKEYNRADSLFSIIKIAFEKGKLPKEDMQIKTIEYAQFEWNGQVAKINRSLVTPKKSLDVTYKIFLLNKAHDKVERRFVVEKTTPIGKDDANYLLCENDKKTGDHITYPYGWKEEIITPADLEYAVKLVLEGKLKMGASLNFVK